MSAKWRDRILTAAIHLVDRNRRKVDRGKPIVGDCDFLMAVDAALTEQTGDIDVRLLRFRIDRALAGGATLDEVQSVLREARSALGQMKG